MEAASYLNWKKEPSTVGINWLPFIPKKLTHSRKEACFQGQPNRSLGLEQGISQLLTELAGHNSPLYHIITAQ